MYATIPYFVAGSWYFSRRDGIVIGPFATVAEAVADLRYSVESR